MSQGQAKLFHYWTRLGVERVVGLSIQLYIPFHWERLTFDRTSPENAVIGAFYMLCVVAGLLYIHWRGLISPSLGRVKMALLCILTAICLLLLVLSLVRLINKLFF